MLAFALDQACTAALSALEHAPDPRLAAMCRWIADEEKRHEAFVLEAFRALAARDAVLGRRLAAEMNDARTWVQQVFPRRKLLGELAGAGSLPDAAPQAHDRFLSSLGDRVLDALGVLGEV